MKRIIALPVAALLCLFLTGCQENSSFNGTKIADAGLFQLNYTLLNDQESASLHLESGQRLRVSIQQEEGSAEVTVGIQGKAPIYAGNGLESMAFTLNISETGDYLIAVKGRSARGSVSFVREEKPDSAAMRGAYQFVLQQIAFEHVYPDGRDTGFDSANGFIEENHFALMDVNRDGTEELIVQFVTAPMAGNLETIYAWQGEEFAPEAILTVFPAVTYYDSGLVKEEWSHSSGLAPAGYWPYNLYQYDAETGMYALLASVDMQSRDAENAYPAEIDTDNPEMLFIVTQDECEKALTRADYEAWLLEITAGAAPIRPPYQPLTEENIKALCD